MKIGLGQFWLGDCLELMRNIPDASIDMILCDLPYGTTQNKWDAVIPFEPLWKEYWRVAKSNAAVVLTAAQPFTSALVMSQLERFKYDWNWRKSNATGHLNAKKMPLRQHEDILLFAKKQPIYNPILFQKQIARNAQKSVKSKGSYGEFNEGTFRSIPDEMGYPRSVIECNTAYHEREAGLHPTQKPVALFEYLIKTYTNPFMTVLDNCAGSGTTAIACENTYRQWVCIEKEPSYYYPAVSRVLNHRST